MKLMAPFVTAFVILASVTVPAPADEIESKARQGTRHYEEGEYAEAAAAFEQARSLAREKGTPAAALEYNLGTTYAREGQLEQAIETLKNTTEATPTGPPQGIQERALYNLGVAEARKAAELKEQGPAQQAAELERLRRALDAFRQSLILDGSDNAARHNFAVVQKRIGEIESAQQQQQQQNPSSNAGESPPEDTSEESQQQNPPDGEQGESPSQPESDSKTQDGENGSNGGSATEPSQDDQSESAQSEDSVVNQPESPTDSGEQNEPEREEQRQEGGLEATPSPSPTPGAGAAPTPSQGKQEESPTGSKPSKPSGSAGGGADNPPEPTQEQLDALRVLNALEENSPDQFRQLFRFRGGESQNLERDW